MNQLAFFDYDALDAESRDVVCREDGEFDRHMSDAGGSFLQACHHLKRIKEALHYKRPGFVDYCNSKPGLRHWTADRMVRVAEMFVESTNITSVGREALYLLASSSAPDAAREEALSLAGRGEPVSHADARAIVERHRVGPQPSPPPRLPPPPPPTPTPLPAAEQPPEIRPAEPPAVRPTPMSRHPYSDHYVAWVEAVASHGLIVDHDFGGVAEMLKEPGKWDRREVVEYILPMLDALHERIGRNLREIRDAFE